ncbi:hypothetical protein [Nocardioides nanhaiensis]|uniref:Uncharacterized protein n=1 Tax=Nocardioides nanhaiensis TaxID=1476871 RepID=A0ABP8W4D5_9ACTN
MTQPEGRRYVVHICPDCNHRHFDHATNPSAKDSCSYTWCPCRMTVAEVMDAAPPQERVATPVRPLMGSRA